MRKRILIILLVLVMMMNFVGCAKKTSVHISVEGIGNYTLMQIPKGFKNFAINDNDIDVTVKKEGVYTFYLKGEDGKEYSFNLSYYDGKVGVSSKDELTRSDLRITNARRRGVIPAAVSVYLFADTSII